MVVVLLAVSFGVFAVVNAQFVEFSWLFGETQVMFDEAGQRVSGGVPLIVLLVASLAIGIAVGMLVSWQRSRTRRKLTKSENANRVGGKRNKPGSTDRS
ncbi:MAG: LapA family protein [Nitriliruptoraceae bacterium]